VSSRARRRSVPESLTKRRTPLAEHAAPARKRADPATAAATLEHRAEGADARAQLLNRRSEAQLAGPAQILQRRTAAVDATAPATPLRLAGPRPLQRGAPNRTGLPDRLKAGVEALSGLSMDDVRVHRNSSEPSKLQAHAFARGSEIYLAPGQETHLPHEVWHIVQQEQGRVSATQRLANGVPINDDKGLEREADLMGEKALSEAGRRVAPKQNPGKKTKAAIPPVQQRLDMKRRVTQKRNLKKIRDQLVVARDAQGNRQATVQEIGAHDAAQHAGQHHVNRNVTLNQLIGDINETLEALTGQNLTDSDALSALMKAKQGAGENAVQLMAMSRPIEKLTAEEG
jgi:hypothetical protein